MKAMHVRVVAVMVLLWVACGRAVAYQDDDMDVSALTRRDPVVEDARSWSGSGHCEQQLGLGSGAVTNGNSRSEEG